MNLIEEAYNRLPVAFQDVMVSAVGYSLYRRRFGDTFRSALEGLQRSEAYNLDQFHSLQLAQLQVMVSHCYETVPYYHQRFTEARIKPCDIKYLSDLTRLPVVEKEDLRSHTDQFLSRAHRSERLGVSHTSGTTGTPITIGFTRHDIQVRQAFLHRFLGWHGYELGQKSVRFSGRTLFPNVERTKIFWRYNAAAKQLFMSSYHLSPAYLDYYVNKLEQFGPVMIDGYPSSIYVLARYILSKGYRGRIRPKLIAVTAETLEDYQRDAIQDAFETRVVNQYSSSEGAPFVTECEKGNYHINPESGIFEFVKPGKTEPADIGEIAEMIVTSFYTKAYPLLRYRIGDYVHTSDERCACGRSMPVVKDIIGRREDILYTKERGYVGRLDPVFKKSPSTIVECQIVQVSVDKFVLRVVPDKERFKERDLDVVFQELRNRLGDVALEVEYWRALPRGANGKLKAVVSLIDNRELTLDECGT